MRAAAVVVRRAAGAAVVAAALAALLVSLAVRMDVLRVSRVLTGSMAPMVPAGSLAATRPLDATSIRTGDVVMFRPPAPFDTGTPVVHRVIDATTENGDVLVHTKGDANEAEDPWTLNASKSTVHELAWSSLTAGRVADVVARAGGSLLLSVVVGLVALRVLVLMWRPRGRGRHREPRGVRWLRDAAAV
ncbi:MAG TPA: signal peptidase I [Frankiaceae bacterium]|nr:signal peptidase I [Frankiaceae bacterium]